MMKQLHNINKAGWKVAAIAILLVPTSISLFSFLNNISGWQGTVDNVVVPMMSMEGTFGNPMQTWRAINSPFLANVAYGAVALCELAVAVFGLTALLRMMRSIAAAQDGRFIEGLRTGKFACCIAFVVWGLFFFAIAGDWFLVWQNPALKPVQIDAINYAAMAVMALFCLHVAEREISAADRG